MFDAHVHRTAAPYPQDVRVKIIEKRAPTDESVALLAEMEDKARERIINRHIAEAGDNLIAGVVVEEMFDVLETRVGFSLNGKKIIVKLDRDAGLRCKGNPVRALAEAVAREITVQIINSNAVRFRA